MDIFKNIKQIFIGEDLVFNQKAVKRETGYGKFSSLNDESKNRVISWNSDEGRERLIESKYNHAFFALAHNYESQSSPFHASLACMSNILNALRLGKGVVPDNKEQVFKLFDRDTGEIREHNLNLYSQNSLLDSETDGIKHKKDIIPEIKDEVAYVDFNRFNPGLSLVQVKQILEIYRCEVDLHYANDDVLRGVDTLRDQLVETLVSKERLFIANFNGDELGMIAGGHFATIGAYHKNSDSALVLDVAAHETPWFWVSLEKLYNAMNCDARDGRRRGYLIVGDTV